MSNPQDNPGTPPPPSPSGSSTPHPPRTTTQPRRRQVKMLARKTVATSALSKKLYKKLKLSQAQDSENSDDSFKSDSEGEGTGSFDSEKAQNSPSKVSSTLGENSENSYLWVEHANVEERGKKSGGSGSGEAAEGLVNLSSHADEPGSSIETLEYLLKKVDASYDPKKRRTLTPKAPSTAKPSKKRKASSQTTTEIPLPKGISTRSRVK
uniref:Uncharacterized protein n=1 Tax=Nicotiana tabacum TaxID=4097 RepID=A0A1S4CQI3_TOBAC|nr:PREDICTED: uncharacterized protein LOC107821411 [Nicotiana tabacum]